MYFGLPREAAFSLPLPWFDLSRIFISQADQRLSLDIDQLGQYFIAGGDDL